MHEKDRNALIGTAIGSVIVCLCCIWLHAKASSENDDSSSSAYPSLGN